MLKNINMSNDRKMINKIFQLKRKKKKNSFYEHHIYCIPRNGNIFFPRHKNVGHPKKKEIKF
ncbi:hypothetical protein [Plasmodium yoelii yoelii]|uniref:Uncharacterized protein n=1 Tax=Plasmodium yoelii yoelii TaxID=73239 RepID=Q7RP83_PLAYO|nr:hypothetical protein [Plasmodium yoelii yoelii]